LWRWSRDVRHQPVGGREAPRLFLFSASDWVELHVRGSSEREIEAAYEQIGELRAAALVAGAGLQVAHSSVLRLP